MTAEKGRRGETREADAPEVAEQLREAREEVTRLEHELRAYRRRAQAWGYVEGGPEDPPSPPVAAPKDWSVEP